MPNLSGRPRNPSNLDIRYAEELFGQFLDPTSSLQPPSQSQLNNLSRAIRLAGGADKLRTLSPEARNLLLKPHRRPNPAIALEPKLERGGLRARGMKPQHADRRRLAEEVAE